MLTLNGTPLSTYEKHKNELQQKLMPELQSKNITLKTGDTLKLHCARYGNVQSNIHWSYFNSTKKIAVPKDGNELLIKNVSHAAHHGFYNCSTKSEFQVSL